MPPIPKSDRLLRRITTLHEQLQQDGDTPSRLERDLMLGYLRELYTVYTELDEPKEKPKPKEKTAPERISTPSPQPAPADPPPPSTLRARTCGHPTPAYRAEFW